jgi:hypothetical protein
MTRWLRAVVLGATLALAFAGSAFSAINPQLIVGSSQQAGNTKTSIEARVGSSDDPVARIQLYVPAGFKLDSPAGGVDVGTVSATVQSKQIGPGSEIPFKLTGRLTAIAVDDPAVAYESAKCDGGIGHAGAWLARLAGGGDSWTFVVFVDQAGGGSQPSYRLVACFKSVNGSNADPYGNKLVSLTLGIERMAAPSAAGTYLWRSLWTPFVSETNGALNGAGSVEAQSQVKLPGGVLTLAAKRAGAAKGHVTLSGTLLLDGRRIGGWTIAIRHGTKATKLGALASVKANPSGNFEKLVNLKGSQYFQAGATLGGGDFGAAGCTASFGADIPCVSTTAGKLFVVSRVIHLAG